METGAKTIDGRGGLALQACAPRRRTGASWGAMARVTVVGAALMVGCGGGEDPEAGGAEQGAVAPDSLRTGQDPAPPPTDVDDPGMPAGLLGPDAAGVAAPLQGADTVGAAGSADAFRTYRIPVGTRIRVTLDEDVSTDVYRPGDAVVATVAETVVDGVGSELIPRGAKLLGRILTATASQGVGEAAVLEMYFETLSALNAEWPVEGAVVSAPVRLNPQAEMARRFSPGRSGSSDEVPGEIVAGEVVEVELRAPVRVSPMVVPVDSLLPPDSVPGVDTVPGGRHDSGADAVAGGDSGR